MVHVVAYVVLAAYVAVSTAVALCGVRAARQATRTCQHSKVGSRAACGVLR